MLNVRKLRRLKRKLARKKKIKFNWITVATFSVLTSSKMILFEDIKFLFESPCDKSQTKTTRPSKPKPAVNNNPPRKYPKNPIL